MPHPRDNAFTLIETVLSLGIVSVIALSTTSIVLLSSRAMPTNGDTDVANVNTREVTGRIAAELSGATSIVSVAARSIVFTVPDRDGDGTEETFRYRWSGTPGDPLEWQYNGGAAITVASGVRDFTVSVNAATVAQSAAGPSAWGDEQVLYEHQGTFSNSTEVKGTAQVAQYFRPDVPAGATAWTPTRALVKMKRSATASSTPVLVATFYGVTIADLPDLTRTTTTTLDASAVTSSSAYANVVITPNAVLSFAPTAPAVLVLAPNLGTTAAKSGMVGHASAVAGYPARLLTSTSSGLLWSTDREAGMACTVYGKFYAPTTTTTTVRRATGAVVTLQVSTGSAFSATAQLLERPVAP